MRSGMASSRAWWLLQVLATAVLYYAVAKLSLVFAVPPGFASAVWPPAGIAAAALMLGGLKLWPGVWLGLAAADLMIEPSIAAPFAIGIGGALEALFIAWSMQRLCGRPNALFSGPGHVFRFVGLALAGATISASIANAVLAFAGTVSGDSLALNWLTWWLGDSMGVILVTPLVLAIAAHRSDALPSARVLELAIAFAALVASIAIVFFESPLAGNKQPIMFLLLPPLIWIAARFDAREVTAAAAVACAMAMYATVIGQGPFVNASLNESLLLQQAFVCTIAVVGLALSVSINELRRAHQELKILVNLASHDLQEPVRNILGFADLLKRRYGQQLDADANEFLGFIAAGAVRMRKLIDDLMMLSRASGSVPAPKLTDGGAALDAALANLAPAIAETGAEVTFDPMPVVLAERTLLEHIFQNLVGNALKFHGGGPPKIHVSARRDARNYLISVRDNGIGIAAQDHQRIFEMFERLHGRAGGGGAGMGLALCKRIVERYDGRIWVESRAGQGATFYFSLPAPDAGPG